MNNMEKENLEQKAAEEEVKTWQNRMVKETAKVQLEITVHGNS